MAGTSNLPTNKIQWFFHAIKDNKGLKIQGITSQASHQLILHSLHIFHAYHFSIIVL